MVLFALSACCAHAGQVKRQDILDMALAAARADGGRLDFEEVLSQVKTFLFAGHGKLGMEGNHAVLVCACVCAFVWLHVRMDALRMHVCAHTDTTASTLGFTVYELTRHPEVEAKLVHEIER